MLIQSLNSFFLFSFFYLYSLITAQSKALNNMVSELTMTITAKEVISGTTSNDKVLNLTFVSSAPTKDFTPSDVKVTNGKIGGAKRVNNTTYTAKFKAVKEGLTKISIPAGKFSNARGEKNIASSEFTWIYDATPPKMKIEIKKINKMVKSVKILVNQEKKNSLQYPSS